MGVAPIKVYLDSCIVIYLLEEHPQFSSIVRNAFETSKNRQFCISPLVELECLVGPLRAQNTPLIQRYENFFQCQIILDIESSTYRHAAELRARHSLKTPDALHLAIAHHYACTELWTNDDRLNTSAASKAVNLFSS
ncbi:type II toxin-antitoxin system VapC family toxin [Leptolyngbya sp. PCC 6406]|uniref:type II toxin-antitoxin system VapC family toxin n=1 Tax=Leptolyngbya sp. PCC 6406 TaxID=1173264 RepID=UPI0002ABD7F5|nr:type II toxin-antitoxin system VapC family toxin [Leptolyngbya sp. PCC 6406]